MVGALLFGAGWAAIPAYLQAKRGSHIVITTIMFNLIAGAVMGYPADRLAEEPGGPRTPGRSSFPPAAHLPSAYEMLAPFGIKLLQVGAAEFLLPAGADRGLLGLGADLADPVRLSDAGLRPVRKRGEICRHPGR